MDNDPLTEAQIAQMTWATEPSKGRVVRLAHTPELEFDYKGWIQAQCVHQVYALRRVKPKNAGWMYRKQCVSCGSPDGQWIKKSLIPNPELVIEAPIDQLAVYEKKRYQELKRIQQRHLEIQDGKGNAEYAAYLRSPLWQRKREKVLLRAKAVCEGCGENAATQVHHLSYRHIYNEFLWELVAICDDCHDRVHRDDSEEKIDEDEVDEHHDLNGAYDDDEDWQFDD